MRDKIADSRLIEKQSFFWSPDFLEVSAWIEHVPFAFWITEIVRPRIIVELGVHNGVSYFAFCQAVKKLNINTVCYGVDTWKGDEHTGFYEEDVYDMVLGYNAREYSQFSTLIKSTFDEANNYFIDGSIELLHIDGLHTYEAVKHDFETWLPKLSSNAIVLFHDINVRERNFGVFKLWEELKQQYRHSQFDFGHGLGILVLGKVESDELNILFESNKPELYYLFLRNIFSDRGNFLKTQFENTIQIKRDREQTEALKATHSKITENFNLLATDTNQVKENYKTLESSHNQLQTAYAELTVANKQLTESYKLLELNHARLDIAHKELLATNGQLTEINKSYIALSTDHEKLKESCKMLESGKEEYEKNVAELTGKLKKAEAANKNKEEEQVKQNNTIEELNALIKKQQKIIGWYKDTYEDRSLFGTLKEKIKSRLKKNKH